MESTGFMNALASATVATQPRKRKRTAATKVKTIKKIVFKGLNMKLTTNLTSFLLSNVTTDAFVSFPKDITYSYCSLCTQSAIFFLFIKLL